MTSSDSSVPSTTITVDGTPTVFLPLTAAWPSGPDCTSNVYLHTPVMTPNTFLAWDPLYGLEMVTTARTCLPPQVTTWWSQPSSDLYTALGPQFTCPELFSAVQTAILTNSLLETYCCPSGYTLLVPRANSASVFPSQCLSVVSSGDMLIYLTGQAEANQSTTTVTMTTSATIFAVPVNGFNFDVSTTDDTDTATATATPSSTATTSKPPKGAIVGASMGSVAGFLFGLGVAYYFWRRRKQRHQQQQQQQTADSGAAVAELGHNPSPAAELADKAVPQELVTTEPPKELAAENRQVYELPAGQE